MGSVARLAMLSKTERIRKYHIASLALPATTLQFVDKTYVTLRRIINVQLFETQPRGLNFERVDLNLYNKKSAKCRCLRMQNVRALKNARL